MRKSIALTCVSLLTLLSACGTPDDGYYDANGNYIPYNRYNREAHDHAPLPGGTHEPGAYTTTVTTYSYDRPGYYSGARYYTTMNGLTAPEDMLPPPGMCRIWFPDRTEDDQPGIESCDGIRRRVPAGAYVIYGG